MIHEWIVIMTLLMGAILYEIKLFPPRHQQIPGEGTPSYLKFKNGKPQISIAALVLYSGLPPILTILINGIILNYFGKKHQFATFMHHFHLMLRSYCLSFTATWVCIYLLSLHCSLNHVKSNNKTTSSRVTL